MGNRIIESGNGYTNVGSKLAKLICPCEWRPARVSYRNMLKGKLSNHTPIILMCNILVKMKDMGNNKIQYQLTNGDQALGFFND